jgi:hypothetical protein
MSLDLLGWLSISSGWPVILSSLKALLETGEVLLLQALTRPGCCHPPEDGWRPAAAGRLPSVASLP